MYYLNNLKEGKLYNNISIANVEKARNQKINTAVLIISNNFDSTIETINSNLLYKNYYYSFFTPRKVSIRNKTKITNQVDTYKIIKERCPNIRTFKKDIPSYKKLNVYTSIDNELDLFNKTVKLKGLAKLNLFQTILNSKISELKKHYKNVLVVFNIDDNIADPSKYFSLNTCNTPIGYIYNIFKKKNNYLLEKENGIKFIFTSPRTRSTFFINSDVSNLKPNVISKKILCISKKVNNVPLTSEEASQIEVASKEETETKSDEQITKTANIVNTFTSKLNVGDENSVRSDTVKNAVSKIEDDVERVVNDNPDKTEEEIIEKLDDDEEFKQNLNDLKDLQKIGVNNKKKEEVITKLSDKQNEIVFADMKIEDILKDFSHTNIEKKVLNVDTVHENIKSSSLKDFDRSYQVKQFDKDLASVLTSFNNDPDVKLFIDSVEKEDTSDYLTKKKTVKITFADDRKVKHTVKFDVPEIKDGLFMHINGGKKLLQKQIMLLPIVKTKPDTVQITTNYNKYFLSRFGKKLDGKTEVLNKIFSSTDLKPFILKGKKFDYKLGNALTINSNYDLALTYVNISEFILNIKTNELELIFNYNRLANILDKTKPEFIEKIYDNYSKLENNTYQLMGYYKNNDIIVIDKSNGRIFSYDGKELKNTYENMNDILVKLLKENLNEDILGVLEKNKKPKSLAYSRIKINGKWIPLVIVLGYEYGLKELLNRYKVEWEFDEKVRRLKFEDKMTRIKFKDGYLYYNSDKFRNSLLLSALNTMDTENYNFEDMETKLPYMDYFQDYFGSRNTGKGIHNALTLMVDPITLDVLKSLKLPENSFDILLYSNSLLEMNSYNKLNDMSVYRIRGAEQINALIYNVLADTFRIYKDTMKAGNPIKMSVPQDILIKKILELPTVDEYSELNPSLEIEKSGGATYKGLSGTNLDNAYTTEIRAYDESMKGIFSFSTPDSSKVGAVRQLSYNPHIINTRGFLDPNPENIDNSVDLFAPAELMSPFTSAHADQLWVALFII